MVGEEEETAWEGERQPAVRCRKKGSGDETSWKNKPLVREEGGEEGERR